MIRLFRVFVPTSTLVLAVFEILVVFAAFLFSINLFLETGLTDYLIDNLKLLSIALTVTSILAGMYFQDLYSQVRVNSKLLLAQQLLMAAGIAFLIEALISTIAPDLYLPLKIMLLGGLLSVAAILAGRLLFSAYMLPTIAVERFVLLGDSLLLDDIGSFLQHSPQSGIQVAGRIRVSDLTAGDGDGPRPKLEALLSGYDSKRVVVGLDRALDGSMAKELLELRFLGYSIEDASSTLTRISNREGLAGLNAARLLYTREFDPGVRYLFFQSMSHSLIAAVSIAALFPLMLLIALSVRLGSRGPVVVKGVRIGRNGIPFTLRYFRVRTVDGASLNRVGGFLARTGLYALPQFFNVLLGQMSLVGPKPQSPEYVRVLSEYIPFYPHRLKMRPGMIGFAQIESRRRPGLPDSIAELEYDLYYLKYASLTMDIFILVQAIKNVLLWGGQP